jgi:hypothetical protein
MTNEQKLCGHAYARRLNVKEMLCSACGAIFSANAKIHPEDEAGLVMPPVIYAMNEQMWKLHRPWPLIPVRMAIKFGWYFTLLHGVLYLVMPIVWKGRKPVSFSARKLEPEKLGLKYIVPKGRIRRAWLSESSTALLGSYGNIGMLIERGAKYVAEGVADAAWLSQLPVPKRFRIVMDGDVKGVEAAFSTLQEFKLRGVFPQVVMLPPGLDPTDVPLVSLRRIIKQQTGG